MGEQIQENTTVAIRDGAWNKVEEGERIEKEVILSRIEFELEFLGRRVQKFHKGSQLSDFSRVHLILRSISVHGRYGTRKTFAVVVVFLQLV
jgi:hypothetical protein